MAGRLAREIQQTKPFRRIEEEAFLNVGRTWEVIGRRLYQLLKPCQLTPTQYNVLRILRGAGAAGVTCSQISDRMITRDPDITRLIDRLEARGLASRVRSKDDRRVVITAITVEGRKLVDSLDAPIDNALREQLGHLGRQRLQQLIELLEALRNRETTRESKT